MDIKTLNKYVVTKNIDSICNFLKSHSIDFFLKYLYKKKSDVTDKIIDLLFSAINLIYDTDKTKLTNDICNLAIVTFFSFKDEHFDNKKIDYNIIEKIVDLPTFVFYYRYLRIINCISNPDTKKMFEKIIKKFFSNKTNLVNAIINLRYDIRLYNEYYDIEILNVNDFKSISNYLTFTDVKKYILNKVSFDEIHSFINNIIKTNDVEILKTLCEKYLIEFTINNLISACEPDVTIDMLEFILLKKIIPNSICFNAVLGTNCYDSHTKILKIKMLLYFGYCPTQEDVEKAYGFGIPIEDFEKYDIKFNSKMFWCCCEFRIYNKYTKSFISSQADFRKIFLYEGLAMYKIKRYKKVKLDINCLRNACTVKDNVRIINYIIKLGIVPDIVCVKNAIHTEDKSYRYESEIKKFDELYPNIITLNNFMQKNKLICCNETFRYAEELLKLSKKNEK